MKTKTEATIEDLYRIDGKAELVDGEIIHMSPTGGYPGYAADEIYASLREFARQTGAGIAVGDNKAFVVNLPHRKSFSPDAAFFVGEMSMKYYQGAPLFAVEVRSEGDYGPTAEKDIAQKRRDYFEAGTKVVWDVDIRSEDVIRSYETGSPDNPTLYRRGDIAKADSVLPVWAINVDDLFYKK
ncbi:MAG: Uma2 family endonuclease [Chloroflexota bacterium]